MPGQSHSSRALEGWARLTRESSSGKAADAYSAEQKTNKKLTGAICERSSATIAKGWDTTHATAPRSEQRPEVSLKLQAWHS